jgi:hypothetical protein
MSSIEETVFIAEAETAMAAGQLYRLVDPGAVPQRQLHADARRKAGLVNNPLLAQTSAQRLYLWPLRHDITPELDLENELAGEKAKRPDSLLEPPPFCGWLFTQQARLTVATYISRQLVQTTPEGKRALLRFYDPRVMSQLPRILHPPSSLPCWVPLIAGFISIDMGTCVVSNHMPTNVISATSG